MPVSQRRHAKRACTGLTDSQAIARGFAPRPHQRPRAFGNHLNGVQGPPWDFGAPGGARRGGAPRNLKAISTRSSRDWPADSIHAGATFARLTETQITETARILGFTEDDSGILHVRYASRMHRANRTLDQGQRTLALPSFLSRFDPIAPFAHRDS